MKLIQTPQAMQDVAREMKKDGYSIGLVPTMGWFHEGHLALMRKAKEEADKVITTLFVNPIQFGPNEDLDSYPHDLERDRKLAESCGVDILYAPEVSMMYPEGFKSSVHVKTLGERLCGASRPGHFDGVTTVLTKLFNQTMPDIAVFGEKDFQQLAVIRQMVTDLDFPIEIIGHPIVRETSGLAMSSRNTYLQEDEMGAALSLSEAVQLAKGLAQKNSSIKDIKKAVNDHITQHKACCVDYVEIVNGRTLEDCVEVNTESQILLAVKINDRIRLIDNSQLLGN